MLYYWKLCFFFVFAFATIFPMGLGEECRRTGQIYDHGLEESEKNEVVSIHNKYREQIARGEIPGQPRGVNLKRMKYDEALGEAAQKVSKTCRFKHQIPNDPRWFSVGQNMFIEFSSKYTPGPNWETAIEQWFSEHEDYTYPNKVNSHTGHYTQLVWHDSSSIGCDYVHFYDRSQPGTPYAKMYTCNYGPGGNVLNEPPYKVGEFGCENLC